MKILKLKYFVITAIILFVGVFCILYFTGGLSAQNYTGAEPFSKEGFIDINDYGSLNTEKVIGKNEKYTLYFNESTTIATIVENDSCPAGSTGYAGCTKVYNTAIDNKGETEYNKIVNASPLLLNYYTTTTGKTQDVLNLVTGSIAYKNDLTGLTEKHYSLRTIENGIQILYSVGQFNAGKSYLPEYIELSYFYKYITGNLILFTTVTGETRDLPDPITGDIKAYKVKKYSGVGIVEGFEPAQYLYENGIANIAPAPSPDNPIQRYTATEIDFSKLVYGDNVNSEDSIIFINPYIDVPIYQELIEVYKRSDYTDEETKEVTPAMYRGPNNSLGTMLLNQGFSILYKSQFTEFCDENGTILMKNGMHATDESGDFVYDNDGNPVNSPMTTSMVTECNLQFGRSASFDLPVFELCLQYKLEDYGLETKILGNSIREGLGLKAKVSEEDKLFAHSYKLVSIDVLPKFIIETDETAEGSIIIPDGSGLVINFNNNKGYLDYISYNKVIYGAEDTIVPKTKVEEEQTIMFPMFGFINNTKKTGVLAIVENGAAQTSIKADVPRRSSIFNAANFITMLRTNETVYQSTNSLKGYEKWSIDYCNIDYTYSYRLLAESELSYSALANKYREYLVEKYELTTKDTTKTNNVTLNMLGAYEEYDLFFGVRYKKNSSLTTFKEAEEIVRELIDNNVTSINVTYTGWSNYALEYPIGGRLKASSVLGGKSGLNEMIEYFNSAGVELYPEANVTTGNSYSSSFGNQKMTAKSPGINYAIHYPYNLATLKLDKSKSPTYMLSPVFYESSATKVLKYFNNNKLNGLFASDLGNLKLGDYTKGRYIYPEIAMLQAQTSAMDILVSDGKSLILDAPFDYAFPYVTSAINIPTTTTFKGIVDNAIPFYQLVVSGLFDYTTEVVNGTNDNRVEYYLLKALETGANLNFNISYTDPVVLLNTDYTYYYKAYYSEWKDIIIDMNNQINSTNIHGGRLISHEILGNNIYKVGYSNGVNLIINQNRYAVTVGGKIISAYSYTIA